MILDSTSKTLRAFMANAATTTNPTWVTDWADLTTTSFTAGNSEGALSGTAPQTIVASPAASTQRQIKCVTIYNNDTVSQSITVDIFDGTTGRIRVKFTIPSGGSMIYERDFGWTVLNSVGQMLGQGSTGGTPALTLGTTNTPGVSTNFIRTDDTILANRAALPVDAKGWSFLGTATGATTTVGPVIWTATFQQLMIKYWIAGYNGGTPVGRLLLGGASISTTALTNSFANSEGVTAPTTGSGATAIPGVPLAVTLSNIGRGGWAFVDGASGQIKEIIITGRNVTPSIASVPTLFRSASFFSDLGTNLPIQRLQLSVYDTLTAVALSAQTFTANTYVSAWGRNND